jgi:hypothetical protein
MGREGRSTRISLIIFGSYVKITPPLNRFRIYSSAGQSPRPRLAGSHHNIMQLNLAFIILEPFALKAIQGACYNLKGYNFYPIIKAADRNDFGY